MKKMISILTVLVLSIVTMLPVKVMAAEYPHKNSEVKHVNLLSDKTEYGIRPQTDGYYYWKVDSKTNQGTTYGSWGLGPQGAGPGTVCLSLAEKLILLSTVIALLGVAVIITYSPQNGVILLVIAFLISPMGLPLAAIWLLGKVQDLKYAIQDWMYG